VANARSSPFELGSALALIRKKDLHKEVFPKSGFEVYCRKRWGIRKSQAYRLIEAARIMAILSPIGEDLPCLPTHESQVRPLANLPEDAVIAIWRAAAKEAGKEGPTQQLVSQKAEQWRKGMGDLRGVSDTKSRKPFRVDLDDAQSWHRLAGYAWTFVDDDRKEDALETLEMLQRRIGQAISADHRTRDGAAAPVEIETES